MVKEAMISSCLLHATPHRAPNSAGRKIASSSVPQLSLATVCPLCGSANITPNDLSSSCFDTGFPSPKFLSTSRALVSRTVVSSRSGGVQSKKYDSSVLLPSASSAPIACIWPRGQTRDGLTSRIPVAALGHTGIACMIFHTISPTVIPVSSPDFDELFSCLGQSQRLQQDDVNMLKDYSVVNRAFAGRGVELPLCRAIWVSSQHSSNQMMNARSHDNDDDNIDGPLVSYRIEASLRGNARSDRACHPSTLLRHDRAVVTLLASPNA
mmetsp:Transcript_31083/g.78706  ORF Transcript_31083/g.78706 Transcript_31083/m.78706 type:complete len:267 (-) Transcript_31083:247-1047(-)